MSVSAQHDKSAKKCVVTVEVWTPSFPSAAPRKSPKRVFKLPQVRYDFLPMRKVIFAFVVGAHLAVIWGLAALTSSRHVNKLNTTELIIRFLQSPVTTEQVAQTEMTLPDITMDDPPISAPAPSIEIEQQASSQSGISAPFTAPRVQPGLLANQLPFKEHAPWSAGQRTRAVLIVDVAADGSATDVEVETGTGDPNVDAIAVAYAQTLRWIPATINGRPALVRTRLVVSMVASA